MEKEKKNKKQVIIGISILLLVTLLLLGLTYAYYRTRIIGNTNGKSVSVTTKNLEVKYDDGNAAVITEEKGISPGYKKDKEFSVTNTGDGEAAFSIKLDNINNGYIRYTDWKYKLYKGDKNSDPIASGLIGKSEEVMIKSYETVTGTNKYILEIEYINSEEDQSVDMGHAISLRVNIDNAVGIELNTAPEGTLLNAIGKDNNVLNLNQDLIKGETSYSYYVPGGWSSKETNSLSLMDSYEAHYGDGYVFNNDTGYFEITGEKGFISDSYTFPTNVFVCSSVEEETSANLDCYSHEPNDCSHKCKSIIRILDAKLIDQDWCEYEYTYEVLPRILKTVNIEETEESNDGLFYTEDDYGTSYYYRGNVNNNYLNFSGMCWRIVRVQGDGGIKIVLADENHTCENVEYNKTDNSALLKDENGEVLNIFEPSLTALSNWLNGGTYSYNDYNDEENDWPEKTVTFKEKNNIDKAKIEENAEWCKDFSSLSHYAGTDLYSVAKRVYSLDDFKNLARNYPDADTETESYPSLRCNFTGIGITKAKKEKSIIGLLTADEVALAGGLSDKERYIYLRDNIADKRMMTMSPCSNWSDTPETNYCSFGTYLDDSLSSALRPAIVLKSDVKVSGEGTQTNPYKVID